MITSQHTYWVYRDGAPVKRLASRRAVDEFCADLRTNHPESLIVAKHTELREQELFRLEPYIQYKQKEVNDA